MNDNTEYLHCGGEPEHGVRVRPGSLCGAEPWAPAVPENESLLACCLRVNGERLYDIGDALVVDWGNGEMMEAEVVRVEHLWPQGQRLGCRLI